MSFQHTLKEILSEANIEKAYITLADKYWSSDESFRKTVRNGWDFGIKWKCPKIIPPPLSSRTLDEQERIIRANLLYFSISANDVLDTGDILIDLAVIYHECLLIDVDPQCLFLSVAQKSIPSIQKLLTEFINRPEEDKSMEAFCLLKSVDENGCISIECEFW
jgi:hypothetical protein